MPNGHSRATRALPGNATKTIRPAQHLVEQLAKAARPLPRPVEETQRTALEGMGNPELLRNELSGRWKLGRVPRACSGFDYFKSPDVAELFGVERGEGPAPVGRGGGNDQVVGADHLSRGGELCPQAGMDPGHCCIQGHDFKPTADFLQPAAPAPGASGLGLGLNAEPQFGNGDGADGHGFRRPGTEPGGQRELPAFVGN